MIYFSIEIVWDLFIIIAWIVDNFQICVYVKMEGVLSY